MHKEILLIKKNFVLVRCTYYKHNSLSLNLYHNRHTLEWYLQSNVMKTLGEHIILIYGYKPCNYYVFSILKANQIVLNYMNT